jgi:hypothetical protein
MQDEIKRYQCRHIFTGGHRCGSPCLRHEEFCYYHHTTRRPVENPRRRRSRQAQFDLPLPEDRSAIQSSIGEVLRRIASNEIDAKRAGLLLYGLQIASINLPRATQPTRATGHSSYNSRSRYSGRTLRDEEDIPETALVEEIVIDPKLGTVAPRAEFVEEEEHLSSIGQFLRDHDREEEEREEEREEAEAAAAKLKSDALAVQRLALKDAGEAPQNSNQTDAILPIIQAHEDDPAQASEYPKWANEDPSAQKNIAAPTRIPLHRHAKPLRQKKSAKKLTRTARIAIVRGFREYPGRAIRETRGAEGWRKARAN